MIGALFATLIQSAGSSVKTNSDGSISMAVGVAGVGFTNTGTQPAAAATGVDAGIWHRLIAPGGGNSNTAGNTGGRGGRYAWNAGAGGTSATVGVGSNSGGLGGQFVATTGAGGAASGGDTNNTGGAGGPFSLTMGNGGAASGVATGTNTGGIGGAFTLTAGNGGNATSGGVNIPGRGGSLNFITGNPGTGGNVNAGDFNITLGTGPNPNQTGVAGRQGRFSITTQDAGMGFSPNVITMDAYGIGVGTNTAAIKGSPINVIWTATDPTYSLAGVQAWLMIAQTADNSRTWNAMTATSSTDTSAFNLTGTVQPLNVELTFNKSGGTISDLIAASSEILTQAGSSCTVAMARGQYAIYNDNGANTLILGHGVQSVASINATGGVADGNITTWNSYHARYQLFGTAVTTPGNIGTFRGFYVQAPAFSSATTGAALSVYGLYADALYNTYNNTSTTGGFVVYGAYLNVGIQGGNTSGTNSNYGLYITGNGGTPGAGGTVNNWAIRSDSTAASYLAGSLTINAGGIAVTGTSSVAGSFNITGSSAPLSIIQAARTGGTPSGFVYSMGAHLTMANSEVVGWNINNNNPAMQFTGGAATITTERFYKFGRPTFDAVSAGLVMTTAATMSIDSCPIAASGNLTITKSYPLWVGSGLSTLTGGTRLLALGASAGIAEIEVLAGSGVPTLAATKGSIYFRKDGTTTNDRAYINTDGSTGWTNLTTGT